MDSLVGPYELARVDVERDDRVAVEVRARAARVPRHRVAGAEDDQVELRVDRGCLPHRAAAVVGVGRRPGVAARLARRRHDAPRPQPVAVGGVEGLHVVADAALVAAARALDHHAVVVERRGREMAALLPRDLLRLPDDLARPAGRARPDSRRPARCRPGRRRSRHPAASAPNPSGSRDRGSACTARASPRLPHRARRRRSSGWRCSRRRPDDRVPLVRAAPLIAGEAGAEMDVPHLLQLRHVCLRNLRQGRVAVVLEVAGDRGPVFPGGRVQLLGRELGRKRYREHLRGCGVRRRRGDHSDE